MSLLIVCYCIRDSENLFISFIRITNRKNGETVRVSCLTARLYLWHRLVKQRTELPLNCIL